MKTQIKLVAIILLMVLGMSAEAYVPERVVSISIDNNKTVVLYMKNLIGKTGITLIDENGNQLFSESTSEGFFGKALNLSSIEEGTYQLEIDSQDRLEMMTVVVSGNSASIVKKEVLAIKPILKVNNDLAKVFFAGSGEAVEITLYNSNGTVQYREQHLDNEVSVKKFDLSDLEEGTYKLKFRVNNRNFYHTIVLN
jgi:YbbR domain-containing protein